MIRYPVTPLIEVIVGGLLMITGLIYLSAESKAIDQMSDIVKESLMEDDNIYQQDYSRNINVITDEQLVTIVMGYREHPITIDGVTINLDHNDYNTYLSLIKHGNYSKSYECDSNNNITRIIFTFIGIT